MSNKDLKKFYEILEIDSDVSKDDITNAYNYLKNLYTSDSMATIPIDDEWDQKDKQEILKRIEEAYSILVPESAKEHEPVLEPVISIEFNEEEKPEESLEEGDTKAEEFVNVGSITGDVLREIRKNQGIDLKELSDSTQIPFEILKNIEKEKFSKLPDAGYLRWYITHYATTLSINPKDASDQYMKRYREWKKGH